MAQSGNDWNSFMQSRKARLAMYGICVFFCVYYAVDAVLEMMSPERSALMMQATGATAYYAITVARAVVLLFTGGAFGRMWLKVLKEEDD